LEGGHGFIAELSVGSLDFVEIYGSFSVLHNTD
jgi:hypothetical protein